MQPKDYPFARSLITDDRGQVQQVVLDLQSYHPLIESLEDNGLYQAMQETQNEESLSLAEAHVKKDN